MHGSGLFAILLARVWLTEGLGNKTRPGHRSPSYPGFHGYREMAKVGGASRHTGWEKGHGIYGRIRSKDCPTRQIWIWCLVLATNSPL